MSPPSPGTSSSTKVLIISPDSNIFTLPLYSGFFAKYASASAFVLNSNGALLGLNKTSPKDGAC